MISAEWERMVVRTVRIYDSIYYDMHDLRLLVIDMSFLSTSLRLTHHQLVPLNLLSSWFYRLWKIGLTQFSMIWFDSVWRHESWTLFRWFFCSPWKTGWKPPFSTRKAEFKFTQKYTYKMGRSSAPKSLRIFWRCNLPTVSWWMPTEPHWVDNSHASSHATCITSTNKRIISATSKNTMQLQQNGWSQASKLDLVLCVFFSEKCWSQHKNKTWLPVFLVDFKEQWGLVSFEQKRIEKSQKSYSTKKSLGKKQTLQGTNISPKNRHFWVDDFPFPVWWLPCDRFLEDTRYSYLHWPFLRFWDLQTAMVGWVSFIWTATSSRRDESLVALW